MHAGMKIRYNQLFRKDDGKTVIIAMDHAAIAGAMNGIKKPETLVRKCVSNHVDGILTNKGFVDASLDAWDRNTSLVLRLTGGFTVLGGQFEERIVADPATAVAYGASCAAVTVKFGHEKEGDFIRQASLAIDECHRYGLPVMVEAMAKGSLNGNDFEPNDPEAIRMVSRMGAEIGADLIKTYYTGSPESFSKVVEECPVPVVILGGKKTGSLRTVLQEIYDSIQAGGSGIAVGRNMWGHANTDDMLKAAYKIVHEGSGVDEVCSELNIPE
jgi:DhnA family fructose-bisphosphate aldolase class Ia